MFFGINEVLFIVIVTMEYGTVIVTQNTSYKNSRSNLIIDNFLFSDVITFILNYSQNKFF